MKFLLILATIGLVSASSGNGHPESARIKRFLIVPPTAPTRHQYIVGVGIPVDTKLASIVSGYVIKAQYYLPVKPEDWKANFFEGLYSDEARTRAFGNILHESGLVTRGKREIRIDELTGKTYESYIVAVEDITGNTTSEVVLNELDDEDFDDGDDDFWNSDNNEMSDDRENDSISEEIANETTDKKINTTDPNNARWIAYKVLEHTLDDKGMHGRACVLRSICEAADTQFSHHSGILGELFHIIFTPSTTSEAISDNSDNEYLVAEKLGRGNAPCERIFSECEESFLDLFTGVHFPFNDFASILKLGL